MKKIYLALLFLSAHSYFCIAQPSGDRIEVIKMAFITREINLTPEEAQRFWPVYNNYTQEVKQAVKDNPNDVITQQEKVVGIRKKYKDEFRKILNSDDRVNKFFTAESNFGNRLRNELQNRQRFKKSGQQQSSSGQRPPQ